MSKPSKTAIKLLLFMIVLLLILAGIVAVAANRKEQKNKEQQTQQEAEAAPETAPTKIPAPEITQIPENLQTDAEENEEVLFETLIPEEKELSGTGKKIAIDPGHQKKGNSNQEPIGPGASKKKAQVASGTSGRLTGVPEYQLNLDVSLKLKEELISRGYEVYMIRETNDVDISNSQRAKLAAESGADILIRIHANGSENTSVAGALTMAPSQKNPFVGSELAGKCQDLSAAVIDAFCEATGANSQGVYQTDEMSGLNWCTIPATIVEMGYMTNPEEDTKMQDAEYQKQMVEGIANGIDRYFAS